MNGEDLLKQLQKMRKTPEKLPDWPLPESIVAALVANPKLSARYVDERLHRVFENRKELGDHLRSFQAAFGLSLGQMNYLNLHAKLQTLPTRTTERRKKQIRFTKEYKYKVLDAACGTIAGLGTPVEMEKRTGVGYNAIYKLVRAELAKHGLVLQDLRQMSAATRVTLAKRIKRDASKEIEKAYERYL